MLQVCFFFYQKHNNIDIIATAMATMRKSAMTMYWEEVLQQDPKQYSNFVSSITNSAILLPFDVTDSQVTPLLTNSTSTPFPPPLACYPSLPTPVFNQVSAVETQVFGLSQPNAQSSFSTSCFPDRPIYGVLDYLGLRLPFRDSESNVPTQAAVINLSTRPRVVLYNGQQFAALPSGAPPSSIQMDPRQYGTLRHIDHVLLNFFSAIPDVSLARALVQYVLSSSGVPPLGDSPLVKSLDSLPVIGVAVIGSVVPSCIDHAISSFVKPSGNVYFGTDQSLALRDWTLNAVQSSVIWTANATASLVVRDDSFTDAKFNQVWDPSFQLFHVVTNQTLSTDFLMTFFQNVNKTSPS
jgi:hypothetical protein